MARLDLGYHENKRIFVIIGISLTIIVVLLYVFTAGGYTITTKNYLNNLREESLKNYERSAISYNIGLLEGYFESLYIAVITSYETWTMTGNSNTALELMKINDVANLADLTRNLVKGLERSVTGSRYYKELLEAIIDRSYKILDAYDKYLESINKGNLEEAKQAIKDMRYNIDMLKITGGNIISRT
ncbi:MAG: hypothetical protein GSR85_04935 [Desulfurococcales archaeon]|nr:hypothetical protein [Desulfurococcales archaeon]